MTVTFERYTPDHHDAWNAFVDRSKNGTFLFDRRYMDYHADRFSDHSLLALEDGELVALFPAHRVDDRLVSHGGLTYGGFVTNEKMSTPSMLRLFEALATHGLEIGVETLRYKCVPHIYHRQPAEEDLYALFRHDAKRCRVDVSCTIDLNDPIPFNSLRRRMVKKAIKAGLEVTESTDFETYFAFLAEHLNAKYDAAPVHTADEMQLLASRFPGRIKLFVAKEADELCGGTIVYDCGPCVHTQYLYNSPRGRKVGALDVVIHHLLTEVYVDRDWFDFGIATEREGRELNEGLARQKEMFGGRAIVYPTYELDLRTAV